MSDTPSPIGQRVNNGEITIRAEQERAALRALYDISSDLMPRFGANWGVHSLVAMNRMALSRVIYYQTLYQKIIDVPGVICEFGVQWGASMALLMNLRGMYEPFNVSRRIIGFDTFEGFPSVDAKDGAIVQVGDYRSMPSYETVLEEILALHEILSPVPHVKKHELVKGDVSVTAGAWLEQNPHALIAMAIFDMDIYQPTRDALEKVLPRLTKGSLLVFDELSCPAFPGETTALQEVIGANKLKLHRFPHQSYASWAVWGE
ncbi:hypothetical protein FHS83_003343 [Rhizomicrobium palustre]|uniref:Crotonobetainyl-CoA--carnitine CoA-transferase n=1 Tax=Rhizomicrobium palustre TaxID=189966 RepID=A0A846N3H5_9PROT|nr:TylF/MycF/NovP-related O-methyltransferase [Rhizomicrobium palustre]NIK90025.1 hypothetical protein [Rhizomicrobium palustre]